MNPFAQCASFGPGAQSILASVLDANPNRAPIWVFIVLGIAIAIVVLVLFFAVPISGKDTNAGGTSYYCGPFGGFGGFGGL